VAILTQYRSINIITGGQAAEDDAKEAGSEAGEDYEEFNNYNGEGGPAAREVGGVWEGVDWRLGFWIMWVYDAGGIREIGD